MTYQEQRRRLDRKDPYLLLAYLRYALNDVSTLSERSGQHLETAIKLLAEDTRLMTMPDAARDVQPS
jgi:hypothetical protein